ncbi:MAG: TIR domain-containing protein, partial [Anaerolineae bacterium]|nr:TIR domain-containing protein [Anaerolineae bacterium]
MMSDQAPGKKPVKLFYSYSHRDERLRDRLAVHLAILKRQGIIEGWHDREIRAGDEWGKEIDENLEAADIILLLVSADFIASDFCWGIEMTRALERHDAGEACVIPVIIKPVDWKGAPFARLQAVPKDARPVTRWSNRESAWTDVAKAVRLKAEEIAAGQPLQQAVSHPPAPPAPAKRGVQAPRAVPQPSAARPVGPKRRSIYDAENGMTLPGKLVREEGAPATGDVSVDETYDALGITADFYWNAFGRSSFDGKGAAVIATVHYGQGYDNAFWNGNQLVLGDGDEDQPEARRIFNRFSRSLDIIAGEYFYGVNQHAAQLPFFEQSGALLVAYQSIFGAMVKQYALDQTVEQADWLIGSELLTAN